MNHYSTKKDVNGICSISSNTRFPQFLSSTVQTHWAPHQPRTLRQSHTRGDDGDAAEGDHRGETACHRILEKIE